MITLQEKEWEAMEHQKDLEHHAWIVIGSIIMAGIVMLIAISCGGLS